MLRLALLVALLAPAAHAQIGVVLSVDADDAYVLIGADDLDGDGGPELVLGRRQGQVLTSLIVRDGRTGAAEWTSDTLGDDLRLAVAGWTGSARSERVQYQAEGDDYEYPVDVTRFGDSPFVDTDGDGDLELVVVDLSTDRLLVIGDGPQAARADG